MVKINYASMIYTGNKASKTDSDFYVFDEYGKITDHLSNISPNEWNYIHLEEGIWSEPGDIPSETDVLRADVDFLTMENEFLETENAELKEQAEVDRADIDYCLMLLEE